MKRRIIKINEEKCNGCGICAAACHEGAIGMVDGKAKLLREDYCDGLGDCLPSCPTGAITFEERDVPAYDHAAVLAAQAEKTAVAGGCASGGCPGSQSKTLHHTPQGSQLNQWPVQIKLAPINAPYFSNAHLLIAADCTAYAHGNFHNTFMKNKVTLIGCPKLDAVNYAEKLTAILANNDIQAVTVVRMEVPCCGGIVQAVKTAMENSGKHIPWQVITITTDGEVQY